jgi:hypothetical protein
MHHQKETAPSIMEPRAGQRLLSSAGRMIAGPAYDQHPADEPDAWGDLASWRRAAGPA